MKKSTFSRILLQWHRNENLREMPWKGEKDPYKIWLSEVILQQTRVNQGWEYYEKFLNHYPVIQKLAEAKDEAVYKLWEGLGYYSRCKNLLHTARFIQREKNGIFPNNYEEIITLKGIGPYTAAAISSFAFNQPYAVVDGNVFRVLSRAFSKNIPVDSVAGKKEFSALANELLDKKYPGEFNQAIMDFGATICTPDIPKCISCPFTKHCLAFKNGTVNQLPVKEKRLVKKKRWFTYFLIQANDRIMVNKRSEADIWENLYEFYLQETEEKPLWSNDSITNWMYLKFGTKKINKIEVSTFFKQQLTHQIIQSQFIKISLSKVPHHLMNAKWVAPGELANLAFPALINQYLKEYSL